MITQAQLLRHADTWIPRDLLGTKMPAYQPTYALQTEFINQSHRLLADCPTTPPDDLIDLGIPGWLRRADALKLYELAYYSIGDILELGCDQGLSTSILALALIDAGNLHRVTTVDTNPSSATAVQHHLRNSGHVVDVVCADATNVCETFVRSRKLFGVVFVDHSHTYADVSAVCRLLPQLICSGGFALFHDYNDARNTDPVETAYGVSDAVADTLAGFDFFGLFGCCALYRRIP